MINGFMDKQNDAKTDNQSVRQRDFNRSLEMTKTAIVYDQNPVRFVT